MEGWDRPAIDLRLHRSRRIPFRTVCGDLTLVSFTTEEQTVRVVLPPTSNDISGRERFTFVWSQISRPLSYPLVAGVKRTERVLFPGRLSWNSEVYVFVPSISIRPPHPTGPPTVGLLQEGLPCESLLSPLHFDLRRGLLGCEWKTYL